MSKTPVLALLALTAFARLADAATWTVNNTGDPPTGTAANCAAANAGTCTLRDALAAAADNDTVAFDVGSNQTITLTSGNYFQVDISVTIDGSGSPGLTIDGNHTAITIFIFGQGSATAKPVSLSNLTLRHAGAVATFGGAIENLNALTIADCTLADNVAGDGGAVYNYGTLTLLRSTLSGNTSNAYSGAIGNNAIAGGGTLNVINSTIVGNTSGAGAAVFPFSGSVSVIHTTFAGNIGGDIGSIGGSLTVTNSILADSCWGAVAGTGNLDGGHFCGFGATRSDVPLDLGPLADNGGKTATLLPGLAAVDAATCTGQATTDQRGVARPDGGACDVGAVELTRRYVKDDAVGANDGTSWADAYVDLQSALADPGDAIWVARGVYKPTSGADRSASFIVPPHAALYGGFVGTGAQRDPAGYPTVLSGDIGNDDSGQNGVDADTSQIVGNNSYHVVVLDGTSGAIDASTLLDGFTITGGDATGAAPDDNGGGLNCNGSGAGHACSPMLRNLLFSGSRATSFGGALYANGSGGGDSSPTVLRSTFRGNQADVGGGAFHDTGAVGGTSSPTYVNDTFTGNNATYGGGIYNRITSGSGTLTVTNATFSGNASTGGGGAIADYSCGGAPVFAVTNTILYGDSGPAGNEELILVCETPTFKNSIVFGSGGSGAGWNSAFGIDGGGNLATDPYLFFGLADNGGFTPTIQPYYGSSSVDAGLDSACSAPLNAQDQRGAPRIAGAHCDIGAVEADYLLLSVSDGNAFAPYGKTLEYIVTITNYSLTQTSSNIRVFATASAALNLAGADWFCTGGGGGAVCTTASTQGPFGDLVTLPPNRSLTWIVHVPVFPGANDATGTLRIASSGASAVADTDALVLFRAGFE